MKLKIGDVIILTNGTKVSGLIKEKFVYRDKKLSENLIQWKIEVGKVYENDTSLNLMINAITYGIIRSFALEGTNIDREKVIMFVSENVKERKKEYFKVEEGEFVVINAMLDGGSTGHDPYPDGHHVFCKRLKEGKYDANGAGVNFYQSGCFNNLLPGIEPIRKMKMNFI